MEIGRTENVGKIPTLEDRYPDWYRKFHQEHLGNRTVPTWAIVGTSKLKDNLYSDNWTPTRNGIDSRFLRVISGAYEKVEIFHDTRSPIELVQIGDEYYVSEDGNRRVCTAHLLGIPEVKAEVTRLVRK
jgi:hypothetical protein